MAPSRLSLLIVADDDNNTILNYLIDKRSALNLLDAARLTNGLASPGEVTEHLATAIRHIESLKVVPLEPLPAGEAKLMRPTICFQLTDAALEHTDNHEQTMAGLRAGVLVLDHDKLVIDVTPNQGDPMQVYPATALPPATDAVIEEIARQCHEANKTYCEGLGDKSHLSWEASPPEIQESARAGVRYMIENLEASPQDLHANWMKDKLAAGYVLGPVKNNDPAKGPLTHPNLRDYAELPYRERFKDELFRFTIGKALGKIDPAAVQPIPFDLPPG